MGEEVEGATSVADTSYKTVENYESDSLGRKIAATGGGNAVADAVCLLKCRGVDTTGTHRSESRSETFVLDEETPEIEDEGTITNNGRGPKETSIDLGKARGATSKKRILAKDENGRPNL